MGNRTGKQEKKIRLEKRVKRLEQENKIHKFDVKYLKGVNKILNESFVDVLKDFSKTDEIIQNLDDELSKQIYNHRLCLYSLNRKVNKLKQENEKLLKTQIYLEWFIAIMIVFYVVVEFVR